MTYTFFKALMEHGRNTVLDGYPSTKQLYGKIAQLNETAHSFHQKAENFDANSR